MVMTRENATSKFGYATVNGVQGFVLLPDNCDSAAFAQIFSPGMSGYASNMYDVEKWAVMEQLGAIFLPVQNVNTSATDSLVATAPMGCYWTSTERGDNAEYFNFSETYLGVSTSPRSTRISVRLAQDYQTKASKKEEAKDPSAPQVEEMEDGAIIMM